MERNIIFKKCSKCKEEKEISNFTIDSSKKTGYRPSCKQCAKKYSNSEEYQKRIKAYRRKKEVKEKANERRRDPETRKRMSEYQKKHLSIPEIKEKRKRYFQREEVKEKRRKYTKERMKNPKWRLNQRMSGAVRKSLLSVGGKRKRSWESLVGYTKDTLKSHLEKLFKPGMSWENYGQWHIDHIRPIVSFDITSYDCEDFKKCWAIENLQPLWAIENIIKNGKWNNKKILQNS